MPFFGPRFVLTPLLAAIGAILLFIASAAGLAIGPRVLIVTPTPPTPPRGCLPFARRPASTLARPLALAPTSTSASPPSPPSPPPIPPFQCPPTARRARARSPGPSLSWPPLPDDQLRLVAADRSWRRCQRHHRFHRLHRYPLSPAHRPRVTRERAPLVCVRLPAPLRLHSRPTHVRARGHHW